MTVRQQLMLVGSLGIALGAGVVWLLGGDYFAMDHHDEPVVVDNGPLRFDFKSKGKLTSPGHYVRDQACTMNVLRTKDDQGKELEFTFEDEIIKIYVEGPGGKQYSPIVLERVGPPLTTICLDDNIPTAPPFAMIAPDFSFENDSFLGLSSKKIKAKDDLTKGLRMMRVGYYVTEAEKKVEKMVNLRSAYGDKPVKVEIHKKVK